VGSPDQKPCSGCPTPIWPGPALKTSARGVLCTTCASWPGGRAGCVRALRAIQPTPRPRGGGGGWCLFFFVRFCPKADSSFRAIRFVGINSVCPSRHAVDRKEARCVRPWLSELDVPEWQKLVGDRLERMNTSKGTKTRDTDG
jgi:hypothetical protein